MQIDPMDQTVSDLSGVTVICNEKTGEITISGVGAREMRSILTSASLYRSDHDEVPYIDPQGDMVDIQKANALEDQLWHYIQRDLIEFLSLAIVASFSTYGDDPVKKIATERKHRRIINQPAWTDVKPAVDPVKEQREAALKQLDKVIREASIAANIIRHGLN